MLVKAAEWRMIEQIPDFGKEPRFSVLVADSQISIRPILYPLPYTGITDTTITPVSHDLFVDAVEVRANDGKTGKEYLFFRKKSETDAGGKIEASTFHNSPIVSVLGDKISRERKSMMEQSSGAGVTASVDSCAMGSPGQEIVAGETSVMFTGGSPDIIDLPSTGHGVLKQTGLMNLMPKAFIPPFSIPDYLPDLSLLRQTQGLVGIFRELKNVTERGI